MSVNAVLYSEWTKIRSVRSMAWALPLAAAILVAFGAGVCYSVGAQESDAQDFDPLQLGYYGIFFAHVAVVAFAVLAVGNEYSTGAIRTSLAVVPQRGLFYSSKLAVGAALALAAGVPASVATFAASQTLLGKHGVDFGAPGTLRAMTAVALYFPLLAIMCMGITAMLRSLMLSMGILVPVLFLLSPVLVAVPGLREIAWYLPDRAGQYALRINLDPQAPYGPWMGLVIMAAWAAIAAAGGWLVFRRRDA